MRFRSNSQRKAVMAKYMDKGKYTGWGIQGRPFAPNEYKDSWLHKNFSKKYSAYLNEFAKQYNNAKDRKVLVRAIR